MQELLDLYYKHVEESFQPGSYSRDMYEILFLSQLNSYMLQFNPVVNVDGVDHPTSLISLVFSGSGSGKDSAIKFLDPLKEKVDNFYQEIFQIKKNFLIELEEDATGDGKVSSTDFPIAGPKRKRSVKETLADEHIPWVKSATDAGMNLYYETYSMLGFGSIGLSSTEFGQDFKEKQFRDTLEKVLELWDSPSKTASRITNEKGAIVFDGIQSGCVMHGAFDEFQKNSKMIDDLQVYLATTLARRGLFVKISEEENNSFFKFKVESDKAKLAELKAEKLTEEQKKEKIQNEVLTPFMEEIIKRVFDDVIEKIGGKAKYPNVINKDGNIERFGIQINLSRGAYQDMHAYKVRIGEECLEIKQETSVSNKRLLIELQSRYYKALRVAAMCAFYRKSITIISEDVEYAIGFVEKSGEYFREISKPSIIVDDVCKFLTKTHEKVTVRNLEEAEIIPSGMTKHKLQDLWERCAEELYQKNMIFRSTMGKANMIQQVWIERLVETEGDTAHISYSTHESQADVFMETKSVPLYNILKIDGIKKMGAGGFKNNSRSINNIEALGNILIYDIDNGEMTIDQCKDAFQGMMGFIYPTKSHMVEKSVKTGKKLPDGTPIVEKKVCQRFRIVLLCKQHFPFGEDKSQANEEYKMLYAEVAKHFNVPFDENAMDSSRFYWIPDQAKTEKVMNFGKFGGSNKIDLTHFMPNLKIHNEIKSKSKVFDSKKYWDNMSVREILERCLKDSIIKNGRNSALFSMAMSLKDKGLSYEEIKDHVEDVNEKFDAGPLDAAEVERTIFSTLQQRIAERDNI